MSLLKRHLKKLAEEGDHEGFGELMVNLSPEMHADLETLLNAEIDGASNEDVSHFLRLRFLFRILLKYSGDIKCGLSELRKYKRDYEKVKAISSHD